MNTNTDPVRALIEKWRRQAVEHGTRTFTGNDHALFANELEAALASAPPSAPVGVEVGLLRWVKAQADDPDANPRFRELYSALAQQPAAPEGCGACGDGCANRSGGCRLAEENPPAAPSGEAIDAAVADALRHGAGAIRVEHVPHADLAAPQQPAAGVGEEIMVNAAHDVYTLPLQPSGLLSGPRFVVHVPGPRQPAAVDGRIAIEPDNCDRIVWRGSYYHLPPKQPAAVDWDEVRRVAQHIGIAVDHIEKMYPGAKMLDLRSFLRNMRRWHERLTAALAAQQRGGAE